MLKKAIGPQMYGRECRNNRPMLVVIAPSPRASPLRLPGVGLFSTKNPPVILINLCTVFAV